ncbi:Cation transporter [Nymphaea thermarum]|nr:Cation transporter [Nymphaea thermarum]
MGGVVHMVDFLSWYYYGLHRRSSKFFKRSYRATLWRLHQFWLELLYFMFFSIVGFVALLALEKEKPAGGTKIAKADLFFMSVSSHTASSLASINLEDLSDSQFVVLIFLMFVGGEVFLSALTLLFQTVEFNDRELRDADIELAGHALESNAVNGDHEDLKLRSTRLLARVALGFHVFVCIFGSLTVLAYFRMIPSARDVLQSKGLNMATFSVFTAVSSFVNCGFLPNNENMIVFIRNSGFLLMVTGQILVGNTLFPACLTLMIWAFQKWSRRQEYGYLWKRGHELGYGHFFHWKTSAYITLSNVGFTVVQFVMFGLLQWGSGAGLTVYQKLVAGLFQSVNARHAGEMAFDLSGFSAALLVVYLVMMFLPPYTFLLPLKMARPENGDDNCGSSGRSSVEKDEKKGSVGGQLMKYLLLPQAAYLVIFVVLICLTERRHLREDPLNFNALTIAFEVASAYGNVGLTTGYSCQRLQKITNLPCTDSWASFSGRWSWKGKAIIIVVMFFGRLKKFSRGGKAWVAL